MDTFVCGRHSLIQGRIEPNTFNHNTELSTMINRTQVMIGAKVITKANV